MTTGLNRAKEDAEDSTEIMMVKCFVLAVLILSNAYIVAIILKTLLSV